MKKPKPARKPKIGKLNLTVPAPHHRHQHSAHHHQKRPRLSGAVPVVPVHPHHKPKPQKKAKKARKPRALAIGGGWACCSAEALAASLRLAGWPVGDEDVLALHVAAGGTRDAGVPILAVLETAARVGLAGVRPRGFGCAGRVLADGVIVGSRLPGGLHAVTVEGDGVWTWGEWHPWECGYLGTVEETWAVVWP